LFDHRLGLALGKSLGEIRAIPADEIESWKAFYSLEPWGWHDLEHRTAAILAQIWNVHIHKRYLARQSKDYYRDMFEIYNDAADTEQANQAMRQKLLEANLEERKQMIAQAFGTMGVKIKEV
jgi:hypothetical protein